MTPYTQQDRFFSPSRLSVRCVGELNLRLGYGVASPDCPGAGDVG